MSYLRWIPPQSGGTSQQSAWRLFPWMVGAAMGVVVAVNAGMIYAALASFPGKAGTEGFDLSNHYNAVLDQAWHDTELGWTILARADGIGRPEVNLTDSKGSPLSGASVAASAERPLGARQVRRLTFRETAVGRYVADVALTPLGQWDLALSASAGGHAMVATRRIIVR
jgi:nitrogen fixation protein FixH